MAVVFINGKRTMLPNSVVSTDEIVRVSNDGVRPSRRAVYRATLEGGIERMDPRKSYLVQSGQDFLTGPDRIKGAGETYFGHKEQWRRDLIYDQVEDLSEHVFGGVAAELDAGCNWVVFPNFRLPEAWVRANGGMEYTRILLVIPDEYPDLPTNGFYLPSDLRAPYADTHFFDKGFDGAYGDSPSEALELRKAGWNWYCSHIRSNSWRPARLRRIGDWRNGDNLYHIITLAREVLTDPTSR